MKRSNIPHTRTARTCSTLPLQLPQAKYHLTQSLLPLANKLYQLPMCSLSEATGEAEAMLCIGGSCEEGSCEVPLQRLDRGQMPQCN